MSLVSLSPKRHLSKIFILFLLSYLYDFNINYKGNRFVSVGDILDESLSVRSEIPRLVGDDIEQIFQDNSVYQVWIFNPYTKYKVVYLNSEKIEVHSYEQEIINFKKIDLNLALTLCVKLFFYNHCWDLLNTNYIQTQKLDRYTHQFKIIMTKKSFIKQLNRRAFLITKKCSHRYPSYYVLE